MKDKLKKYLLPNLPYLFFVYLFDKICQAVRLAPGLDASEKLLHIGQGFQTAFASSAPSFHALDICVGILGAVLVRLAVYVKGKNAKKYRKGIRNIRKKLRLDCITTVKGIGYKFEMENHYENKAIL